MFWNPDPNFMYVDRYMEAVSLSDVWTEFQVFLVQYKFEKNRKSTGLV